MAGTRRWHLWSGIIGGIVAALIVSAVPAVADLVGTQVPLNPGDPVQAGRVNDIDGATWLRGTWQGPMLRLVNNGTGLPLVLEGDTQTPPLTVNSKVRVPTLNVDRVDNRHASQMVRAAGARSDNLPNENGELLTATIDAPYPGLLVMGASLESFGSEADFFTCRVKVDGTTVPGSSRDVVVHNEGPGHTTNNEENCVTDGIAVVPAGSHTVAFTIGNLNTASLVEASLWVLWVGFDGQGLRPTPGSINEQ